MSAIPRDLRPLCIRLESLGGRIEKRGRSFHAYGPDGSWLGVFSTAPRNLRGSRQSLQSKLRKFEGQP